MNANGEIALAIPAGFAALAIGAVFALAQGLSESPARREIGEKEIT